MGAPLDLRLGDYSESEQPTRYRWIDGKTIYRKTVNFGILPNGSNKAVPHGINFDTLVDINIMASAGSTAYPVPQAFNSNMYSASRASTRIDSTNINISVDGSSLSTHTAQVTLFYTKSD